MGAQGTGLTAELFLDRLTPEERSRAERVESVLPALRDAAAEADRLAEFPMQHVKALSEAGLLGLVVPEEYGGLGGGLRDLAAATFAMGTACPSTALAYFFQCSSTSRGLLPLEAIDAGLFAEDEVPVVRAFAQRLLRRLGQDGRWTANFASESAKSSAAAITISTRAEPAERDGVAGWLLNGVKSFGCATGVADDYLVSAMFPGGDTAEFLGTFIVARDSEGVSDRARWDAIGMRASATHGIVLEDVFVAGEDALTVPGSFPRMTSMSRGSFVGSQLAGTAVYLGAARAVYDYALGTPHVHHLHGHGRAHRDRPVPAAAGGTDAHAPGDRHPVAAAPAGARDLRAAAVGQGRGGGPVAHRQGHHRGRGLRRGHQRHEGVRHVQHRQLGDGRPVAARPLHGPGAGLPGRTGTTGGSVHDRHRTGPGQLRGRHVNPLDRDLFAMVGVWHDHLTAWDVHGRAVDHDPFGGVPGPFPYDNLVYCDFDGSVWTQTNVTFRGREPAVRTFEADVADGVLTFRRLGPEAPEHVGVSGGPGLIWFVSRTMSEPGLQRYCEPDLIRLELPADGSPARRWRTTVLWRDAELVRPMLVEGLRISHDTSRPHEWDPRGADAPVHQARSVTQHYLDHAGEAR